MNTTTTTTAAAMLAAIHADPLVGRGSCSVLSECFTDELLAELLALEELATPAAAVLAAHRLEMLYAGQALEARWGEDDDPQLLAYNRLEEQTTAARLELEYWNAAAELAPEIPREDADSYRLYGDDAADAADLWTASRRYELEIREDERAAAATITDATITAPRLEITWTEIAEYGLDALAAESERIIIEHRDGTVETVEVESLSDVSERWRSLNTVDILESVTITHWTDNDRLALVYVDSTDAVYLVD